MIIWQLLKEEILFGYTDLVVDFRGIPTMRNYACNLDVTHSLQQPNQNSGCYRRKTRIDRNHCKSRNCSRGRWDFIETHPDPSVAKSDGANMLKLDLLDDLLGKLTRVREAIL